ncbi:hypothetical protein FCV25MIE_09254 [Fagus crenata]
MRLTQRIESSWFRIYPMRVSMADQEEDLRMAMRMSMQPSPLEPKRSKPRDAPARAPDVSPDESPDSKSGRLQRELMATAAEK